MAEQVRGERELSREDLEEQKYKAFVVAQDAVREIQEAMDHVFYATAGARAEAERIILERFADKMDAALKEERQTLDEWLEVMRENRAKDKREIGK